MPRLTTSQTIPRPAAPSEHRRLGDIQWRGPSTSILNGTNTGANVVSGAIGNGGGTVRIVKSDAGSWTLGGNNTFTGGVTINAGTLLVGSAGA